MRWSKGLLTAAMLFSAVVNAQNADTGPVSPRHKLQDLLSFEAAPVGTRPGGWSGGPADTLFTDKQVVHGGQRSARIERSADRKEEFSTLSASIPIDFTGAQVELRGFLRTRNVSSYVGLWLRLDGEAPNLAIENMSRQQVAGTRDWAEYTISLPLRTDARRLVFGVLLRGEGEIWADDLRLLVDGKPISEAPTLTSTSFEGDRRFETGSGLSLESLGTVQIENLATLGKVWGYLKYHHPAVTAGNYQWDYELLNVMPKVIAATNRADANVIVARWVDGLAKTSPCDPCSIPRTADIHQRPRLEWLGDERALGSSLSRALLTIQQKRPVGQQFFVTIGPNVANPVFNHELAYRTIKPADAGFQLLALFRYWNIIEYWYPNRDLIGEDWDAVLHEFVPRLGLAQSREAYERELMALITRINDTHANLQNAPYARPPVGTCIAPAGVRFVQDRPVITGFAEGSTLANVQRGDILISIDGAPISKLVEQWSPYYSASNEVARLHEISRGLMRGACGKTVFGMRREGRDFDVSVERVPSTGLKLSSALAHDRPGDAFLLLSAKVAYLKLSNVKGVDVPEYIRRAEGTDGLIVDIRNYPSDFVVFTLGSLLVDRPAAFATFTHMDLSNPGTSYWAKTVTLTPTAPHYPGKVVILVDESSISSSEYTAMALRASPRAVVVGSTTAGADGNISPFPLPGGLRTVISGLGVFYPDRKPTQRIGIVPDIVVNPTIEGLRDGRDEVLEAAIRQITG